jgi:hypothetical protein
MKWFKHQSDSNVNAKLQELVLEYGFEGYGVYWYCLELIAGNVEPDKMTFELEHDARLIARYGGVGVQRVEEIMKHMIKLDLFECSDGRITCLKLAKRCDDYTAKLVKKKGLQAIDSKEVLENPTKTDKNPLEENRLEQIRTKENKNTIDGENATPNCPHKEIIELYHKKLPTLSRVIEWPKHRQDLLRARWKESKDKQDLGWWEQYFDWVSQSKFLLGNNDRNWQVDLEWLIRPQNMPKVIEGKYHR